MNTPNAANILGCKEDELEPFSVQDPFNPNVLEGFLCRRGDHRYGALVIHKVNGQVTPPQVIYCTPKLHYPFSTNDAGERNYTWKLDVAYVYTKWDGTNICAYSYVDENGTRFQTYKTRLTPVLRESKFGSFKNLWEEILVKYPALRTIPCVLSGEYSLSFELYGYRNPILIQYDTPLETSLLFGVKQDNQQICVPQDFKDQVQSPINTVLYTISSKKDAIDIYEQIRKEANKTNKHNEDGGVIGTEGFVFYALDVDGYKMWKCKPEDIERVHWSSGVLERNAVFTTVWNALENVDINDVTYEYMSKLLLEEFTIQQIERSKDRIEHCISEVRSTVAFREQVRKIFEEGKFLDSQKDKGTIMRFMSPHFDRKKMRDVYNALHAMNIL